MTSMHADSYDRTQQIRKHRLLPATKDKDCQEFDKKWMNMIDGVKVNPVFIMGDHRTGTTILAKLLSATRNFNTVTVYHVINFHRLLHDHVLQVAEKEKNKLAILFEQKGLRHRGIDTIGIDPDTPEEYAFILKKTGYRPQLKPGNFADLLTLCRKVTVTGFPKKAVLLKNPWDFLNFMYVKEAFPNSRFVFIHRHPVRTVNSQLKATRSIFNQRNEYIAMVVRWYERLFHQPIRRCMFQILFSSLFESGLWITTRHIYRANNYFLTNIDKLPNSDFINVRYEDLCATPGKVVDKILNWLQITQCDHIPFDSFISRRLSPLLPDVSRRLEKICKKSENYMKYFGYDCIGAL